MPSWAEVMDTVVRDRRQAMVGFAFLLTGSLSEAEDITQDAIVKTFVRGRSRTTVEAAEAYIKKAIANETINRARHRKVVGSKNVVLAAPDSQPGPDAWVGARADLSSALLALTPQERACVVLRYFDDLTVPQVADALKLGDGTVKRYLFNATEKLRGQLGDQAVDGVRPESVRVAATSGGQ